MKILICKFIEFSLPGNYLKKTLVSPFKSANCLISNFVFYTTIALIPRLRVLFFLYISRKRIINFIFKSVSIFFLGRAASSFKPAIKRKIRFEHVLSILKRLHILYTLKISSLLAVLRCFFSSTPRGG